MVILGSQSYLYT